MSYKITCTVLNQWAALIGQGYTQEEKFQFECKTKSEAKERIHTILTRGVSRTFELAASKLTPSQTVFYPAHMVQRLIVEPPIPDYD